MPLRSRVSLALTGLAAATLTVSVPLGAVAAPADRTAPAPAAPSALAPAAPAQDGAPVAPSVSVPAPELPKVPAAPASNGQAWSAPAASVEAPAAAVAAPALATGADRVRVVTTQVVDGRPVISTTTVPASKAVTAVDRAQEVPGAVSVAVDTRVTLAQYNDPLRPKKWDLTALGGETFHSRVTTSGVTVAVIDTGVDGAHPDLKGVLVGGAQFTRGTDGSIGNGQTDGVGHGTHVAGLIAAVANNQVGTVGMAPGTRIMPVRVLDPAGSGWSSDVARGIYHATAHGAKVINISLGGAQDSTVDKAVQYATSRGVVVVAAAGNERQKGNPVTYPAAYPNVIGVGATTQSKTLATFSNTGSYVDVVAPGVGLVSTYPVAKISSGYASMSGTSMATPLVSATVAGLKAARPSLTTAQVQSILSSSAQDLGASGRDSWYGAGLINPNKALCTLVACPATLTWSAPTFWPVVGTYDRATVTVRTANGAPVVNQPVQLCYKEAGSTSTTCATRRTSTTGTVDAGFTARRITAVTARFAGAPGVGAAASGRTFNTLFKVTAGGGYRTVAGVVAPRQSSVALDRWDSVNRRWVFARRATTSSTGRVTFSSVAPGAYRIFVPASSTLAATASGGVTVR